MCSDICQQVCAGWRTNLVVDDPEAVALLSQSQHGLGKVATVCAIHPTGTKDQVLASCLPDELITFQLGRSIHAERPGGVCLQPRLVAASVKYIVGGVVNQPG